MLFLQAIKFETMKNILKTLAITALIVLAQSSYAQLDKVGEDGHRMINLMDPEYSDVTFQDVLDLYKGKVIYLDFWASWCRPCKNEMPHSAQLKKKLEGKDVVFVYMSSDQNEASWRKAVDELNIVGENFRTNKQVYSDYNGLLNVRYIPRYVLIDKEGNIVDENAKRPSNPEILNDINKLL